jgi:hypothetical protein
MDDPTLRTAHRRSLNNRSLLRQGGQCGCFYCLKIFDAASVTNWTDDSATALCPYCHIDAVLCASADRIDTAFLNAMHETRFDTTETLNLSLQDP